MEIKQIGKIVYGQDGAVFGGYLLSVLPLAIVCLPMEQQIF